MILLNFDGELKLRACCAQPANRVREATVDDVIAWLKERPGALDKVRNALPAPEPKEPEVQTWRQKLGL